MSGFLDQDVTVVGRTISAETRWGVRLPLAPWLFRTTHSVDSELPPWVPLPLACRPGPAALEAYVVSVEGFVPLAGPPAGRSPTPGTRHPGRGAAARRRHTTTPAARRRDG